MGRHLCKEVVSQRWDVYQLHTVTPTLTPLGKGTGEQSQLYPSPGNVKVALGVLYRLLAL